MSVPLYKSISQGNSATALYGTAQTIKFGVQIRFGTQNTGRLAIGFADTVTCESAAATDGYQLAAGESIWIPKEIAGDLTSVFLIASTSAQIVYILAF